MRKKSLLCILTVCTLSVTTIGGCSTGTPDPVSEETTAESSSKATEDSKTEIGAFWAGHEISHAFDNN